MTNRRWVLSGLLGMTGSMLFDIPINAAEADEAALPEATALALNRAEVAFSQRPQLHYNRQRQFHPPQHRQPRTPQLRRSRGRLRPAQAPSRP